MANLTLWESLQSPPDSALKPITGGRLSGMTDINPQWRLKAMTEQFGPVGVGWKYTIDDLWLEPVCDEQVCAFARVSLYWCSDAGWTDPIPGIGGSMLVEKESKGLHASDEAYKMAVTDALSVAMKALGMGADVYMGQANGSKYKGAPKTSAPKPPATQGPPNDFLEKRQRAFFAAAHRAGAKLRPDDEAAYVLEAKEKLKSHYNLEHFNEATMEQLQGAIDKLNEVADAH